MDCNKQSVINTHYKGPATRNDFVNDIVNDARADAIFAKLKAIVDDEKSTILSTISLRVQCRRLASTRRPEADSFVNAGRQVWQVVGPAVLQLDWGMKLEKRIEECRSGHRTSAAQCVYRRISTC